MANCRNCGAPLGPSHLCDYCGHLQEHHGEHSFVQLQMAVYNLPLAKDTKGVSAVQMLVKEFQAVQTRLSTVEKVELKAILNSKGYRA